MRIIHLDFNRILTHVTSRVKYVSWIPAATGDMPTSIGVQGRPDQKLLLTFMYGAEIKPTTNVELGNSVIYKRTPYIVGVKMPAKNFKGELNDLIFRLREDAKYQNEDERRVNCRVVAAYLSEYADELFLPGQ